MARRRKKEEISTLNDNFNTGLALLGVGAAYAIIGPIGAIVASIYLTTPLTRWFNDIGKVSLRKPRSR